MFADVFGVDTKKLPYDGYRLIATAKLKPEPGRCWSPGSPAGQDRMAADLMLLAEVEQLTAGADFRGGRRAHGLGMALQQALGGAGSPPAGGGG